MAATRDIASLAVGIWILLFRDGASPTLDLIGYACLGTAATGAVLRALSGQSNGKK